MADIAINPVVRRVQFTGNTGLGPFAFTFNILQNTDIIVYKNTTLLTLTTDYTVTINANGTGSVTLTGSGSGTALITTDNLTIIGGRELSRTTDFVTAGDLLASSLNEQLDSNVIMSQQLDERFSRTISVSPGDADKTLTLPTVDDRKDKILKFDTEGNVEAAAASTVFANTVVGANFVNDVFTGTGAQTVFTLSTAPGSKNNCQIYIDGVYQEKSTFSINASTLTFTEAPPLNASIEVIIGNALDSFASDANAVNYDQGGTGYVSRTVESKLRETVSSKDFGVSTSNTPAQNLEAVRRLFWEGRGKHILFDVTDGDIEVSEAVYIGSGTLLEFVGNNYLRLTATTANGLLMGINDLIAYDDNGVSGATSANNATIINVRLDAGGNEGILGQNALGFTGNNHTVLGGEVRSAYYDAAIQGGKGVSAQTGDDHIRVIGVKAVNCDLAFDINGNPGGACRAIEFSSITAEDCAVALSIYCQDTLANQTAEYNLGIVNGLTAINCGLGNNRFFRQWQANTAYTAGQVIYNGLYAYYVNTSGTTDATSPTGTAEHATETDGTVGLTCIGLTTQTGGIITSDRGSAITISNVNVVNDTGYGTIGGFYRGNGSYIQVNNATIHADVDSIINGDGWLTGFGTGISTGRLRYSSFDVRHFGTADYAIEAMPGGADRMINCQFTIQTDVVSTSLLDTEAQAKTDSVAILTDLATQKVVTGPLNRIPTNYTNGQKTASILTGSWTPTFSGSGGSAGAAATSEATGRYVRIGNIVHLNGFINISNVGSWTGTFRIDGLPFISGGASSYENFGAVEMRNVTYTGDYAVVEIARTASNSIAVRLISSGSAATGLLITGLTSGSTFGFSLTYQTAY